MNAGGDRSASRELEKKKIRAALCKTTAQSRKGIIVTLKVLLPVKVASMIFLDSATISGL